MEYTSNIEELKKLLLNNHNLILTGAPGTGKTHLAKEIAKSMGATDDTTCKLVQFHPSYDYTDFVEGLRPVNEGGQMGFKRQDGVFKKFCQNALGIIETQGNASFDRLYNDFADELRNGSKTLDTKNKAVKFCISTGEDENSKHARDNIEQDTFGYRIRRDIKGSRFINRTDVEAIFTWCISQRWNQKDSLYTSDKKFFSELNTPTINKISGITTPTKSYSWSYEKAVVYYLLRKYRAQGNKQVIENDKYYIFIIDEINRGEVSKIFGELFYSIDPGYRGIKGLVATQYQNLVPENDVFAKGFFVPENVYIIGTMNDIDRSVESMDFAMRRRFAWKEITVESRMSMLDEESAWEDTGGKPSQDIIEEIKIRMKNLNDCIIDQYQKDELSQRDKVGLTKAYQIGASYFLKFGMYGNFDDLWTYHLEGLLRDYLRGKTDIEAKMERLNRAYNDNVAH